jgi:hypothetical protein
LVIIQELLCNFYAALHHDPKPLTVGPGCRNKGQHLRQPDGTGDNRKGGSVPRVRRPVFGNFDRKVEFHAEEHAQSSALLNGRK